MPFTYMLRCCDRTLYTGYTVDMEKRLVMHLKGEASKYTRVRLPVEVVYVEEFETKSDAMKRECAIKKLSKSKKEELILSKPFISQK